MSMISPFFQRTTATLAAIFLLAGGLFSASANPQRGIPDNLIMFGGYGEKVENPEDVPGAIERALHAVQVEKRQALLHFVTGLAW